MKLKRSLQHPVPVLIRSPHKLAVRKFDTNLPELVIKSHSVALLLKEPSKQDQKPLESPVSPESPKLPELDIDMSSAFGTSPSHNTNGGLLTPIQNGLGSRRISNDHSSLSRNGAASLQTNGDGQNIAPSSPFSPPSDSGQWSSAVGHATTGGKSGRVIEKLMADNDRLKRELREQATKAEELQRNMDMYKPRIDALQAENDNLNHSQSVDSALLARRDRMISELKDELSSEKERRKMSEAMGQRLTSERDEAIEEKRREVQTALEKQTHAETHTQILEKSYKQLSDQYQARVQSMRMEVEVLEKERDEDRTNLAKMDIVSEQMRQEVERAKKLQAEMVDQWAHLKQAQQQHVRELEEETKTENDKTRKLSAQMDEVVNQMKWVMGVKQNTNLDGSKDDSQKEGSVK